MVQRDASMRVLILAVAVQMICAVCVCEAQPKVDVGGSFGMSRQSTGPASPGGLAFVDREFTPRLSIGLELAGMAEIIGQQQLRTDATIADVRTHHRDTVLSALAKYRIPCLEYFDVALVAGGGAAVRRTTREGTVRSLLDPRASTPIDDRLSNVVPAGTVGFEGTFYVSPRTALVLTARWHLLNDNSRSANEGATMFTFGGGGRVSF